MKIFLPVIIWKIHEHPAFIDDFPWAFPISGVGREGRERGLDFEDPTGEEATTVAVTEGWGTWHCHATVSLGGWKFMLFFVNIAMDDGPLI